MPGTEDKESAAAQVSGPMGAFLGHCALIDALYETLSQRLEKLNLTKLYEEIELPLCPVLAEMERSGVLVDRMLWPPSVRLSWALKRTRPSSTSWPSRGV